MTALHQHGDLIHVPTAETLEPRYRIVGCLGKGGMGTTYEAQDLQTGLRVAIKTMSLSQIADWKILELFEREAKVLASLNCEQIPDYLDYFQIDTNVDSRCFYLVQQLIEGQSLAALIADGWHANEAQVKEIAKQVLEILAYLHYLTPPVIHRDIKPQNIIRQPNGQVALVDFGAVQDVYRHSLLKSGTFVGTYGYMPPEQLRGIAFPASDLYGLGATLVFLLTGRSPADLPQSRMKIDFRRCVNVSAQFAGWLDKMLEPAVEDRFKSAKEALNAFQNQHHISEQSSDTLHPPPKGTLISVKRNPQDLLINLPLGSKTIITNILLSVASGLGGIILLSSSPSMSLFFLSIPLLLLFTGHFIYFSSDAISLGRWVEYLKVDRQFLELKYVPIGKKRHCLKIALSQITYIALKKNYIEIHTSNQIRPFGFGLTIVEKEWLIAQLSSFIQK